MTQDTLDAAAAARLRLSLLRLARRIRQQLDTGVTFSQLSALSTLQAQGPMRPIELATAERISKSSVTRLITKLETQECIETHPNPADGRSSYVHLTANGQELVQRSMESVDAFLANGLAALNQRQQQQLLAVIPVIERILDADS